MTPTTPYKPKASLPIHGPKDIRCNLEYAGDTVLMALTSPQLQSMLSALESVAQEYGMKLNHTKTEVLEHLESDHTALKFLDGSTVPTVTQVKYPGSRISWNNPFQTAFYHRLGLTEEAFKKLRLVWNSSLPRAFIILLYGLDSLTLTDKLLKKIDGQCYRFLRRSIGVKASYYSRITNREVWIQAGKPWGIQPLRKREIGSQGSEKRSALRLVPAAPRRRHR